MTRLLGIVALSTAVVCTLAFGQGVNLPVKAGPRKAGVRKLIQQAQVPASLKRAFQAMGTLHYSGTRIVEFKVGPNRQRHTEYIVHNGSKSRVEFPNESPLHGQIIVEDQNQRRHFFPDRNELRVLPPRREEAFGRIATLAMRGFRVAEQPGGTLAGLTTQLVSITDKQGNTLQKLWIEPRSGMIVKRELYDRGGALQAFFEFTQVNLTPNITETEFNLNPKGAKVITPEAVLKRLVKRNGFLDVSIPPGTPYHLEAARVQKIGGQSVLVQQYIGGNHRLTLFQLKSQVDPATLARQARGDIRTYAWQGNGSSFVLVGDLKDEELRDLAKRLGG